ncbi:MAG: hypothetical protein CVT89_01440 [Candidatus Altiarchaeales archaeon HGW-Altiarchaeales-2]|nr:MAG: hypothetical protein CVT89_01440 [Candidatus Altiarchaeales archaeon HGW-Altiarchaeales-2]
MPVLNPPNCSKKIALTLVVTCVVVYISLYLLVNFIGLMGIFVVLGLTLPLTVWILDIYGDRLFTAKEYMPLSKEKINEIKDKKITECVIYNTTQTVSEK